MPQDASAIALIYDPIVATSAISFEDTPPGADEMRRRIVAGGERYPWLVFESRGRVLAYAYAAQHRVRAAYRWSVDVSAYVAPDARRLRIAARLYAHLFGVLAAQGYCSAFAGVALPNDPSVALHRTAGFEPVGVYHCVGFKLGAWHDVLWLERRLQTIDAPLGEPLPLSRLQPPHDYRTGTGTL